VVKSSRTDTSHAHTKSRSRAKKHVGDVLGISRAQAPIAGPPAAKDRGGNPKGLEVSRPRQRMKRAGVVGGVRGRGH
jgi:hypothetical protein